MKKSGAKPMPKTSGADAAPKEMIPGERIYLLRARTVEMGPGHSLIYPAGYYHLPPEQAKEWIRDGLAVPEPEWLEKERLAQAAAAAQADPVMHLAGPHAPTLPADAPEGKMWPAGPKGSHQPAVEPAGAVSAADLDAVAKEDEARQATTTAEPADGQTSATEEE